MTLWTLILIQTCRINYFNDYVVFGILFVSPWCCVEFSEFNQFGQRNSPDGAKKFTSEYTLCRDALSHVSDRVLRISILFFFFSGTSPVKYPPRLPHVAVTGLGFQKLS